MHGHDSCSWTALKALNFAAAVPAKGRLDLGSLEAPCSSERDPSKFRIGVPLVGKCALLLPHPLVRHHVWRNRDPAGAGRGSAGQDMKEHSMLIPGLGVGADPAGLVGGWLGPGSFSLRSSGNEPFSTSRISQLWSHTRNAGQGTASRNGAMGSDAK